MELGECAYADEKGENHELRLTPFISVKGSKYLRIKTHPSNIAPTKSIKSKKGDVPLNYDAFYEGFYRFSGFQAVTQEQTKSPYLNLETPRSLFEEKELELIS